MLNKLLLYLTIKFRLVWRDQAGGNIDESVSNLSYDAITGTAQTDIIDKGNEELTKKFAAKSFNELKYD